MKEFFYPSQGAGQIHACRWEPTGAPRAIVQLVHGVAEYVERYDDFARYLNAQGILVVGEDHMGHGKSIGESGTPGAFAGGWESAVADTYSLFQKIRQEFPTTPYFLLGHSMGSFMARTFLIRYPDSGISGAIIMGTGWQNPAVLCAGRMIAGAAARLQGETAVNDGLQSMMFGGYSKPFPEAKSTYAWLNTDEAAVERYEADALCGFPVTNGLARDMMVGLRLIQNPKNLAKMDKQLPVLFVSGDMDPVGDLGKGVRQTFRAFTQTGMKKIRMKLYPNCRHEILNEPTHMTVYEDILHWITEIVG